MASKTGFLDVYTDHGIELERSGSQMKGDCPFCGRTAFYVNLDKHSKDGKTIDPGMWNCMTCGEGGNQYTFLRLLWERSLGDTTKQDLRELSGHRGLAASTLQRGGLCKSITTGAWLIPGRNGNGNGGLSNLYQYDGSIIRSSPNCSHVLWGHEEFKPGLPTWVVEGFWDRMAWIQVLTRLRMSANVLGCPGANTFKRKWMRYLRNQSVYVAFDNDDPGRAGQERVLDLINSEEIGPSELHVIDWAGSTWNDLRDIVTLYGEDAQGAYDHIMGLMVKEEVGKPDYRSFTAKPRSTFDELLEDFKDKLLVTESFECCLASSLSVSVATKLRGEPLWMYIVGPPSSGKSTICEALSCSREFAFPLSKIRPNALDSGWQTEGKGDVSLIPMFNGKTLIIKDFTTVLSMPQSVQENIFGILRDCYDGVYRSKHGGYEGGGREYWSKFGIVAGVTESIRILNRTALGERFLQVEIEDRKRKTGIETAGNLRSIEQMERELVHGSEDEEMLDNLRGCTLGFLESLHWRVDEGVQIPVVSEDDKSRLAHMAEFCSITRSQVKRDHRDKLLVRPTRERGYRLSRQLLKMIICLSIVFGDDRSSDRTMSMVRKIALDTSSGFILDIVMMLLERGEQTAQELSDKCSLSEQNVRAALGDMRDLGMIRSFKRSGRAYRYVISNEIVRLWEGMQ